MRNGHPFCTNCGQSYEMKLPAPVEIVNGMIKGFIQAHRYCKKRWHEPVPTPSLSVAERMIFWLEHGERGVSSETIFARLGKGNEHPLSECRFSYRHMTSWSHPLDPDDFKRCHKLLEIIPEWRSRLDELKTIGVPWPALVDNWDRLTEMLLEQLQTQEANGMYEFMKKLGC